MIGKLYSILLDKISSKKGFTLVELLVAISIIGMLFGVVISSSSAVQKSGRDSQRKSDLMKIKSGLQQYYSDNNSYPTSIYDGSGSLKGGSITYIREMPKDPAGNEYLYQAKANATGSNCASTPCHYYYLCVNLENPGSEGKACSEISGTSGSSYYKLTPN